MIKKILAALFGQGIKFDDGTFSEALSKAEKEHKLVFVNAYTYWCGPCKLMSENIFSLQSVGEYYNHHFINVNINMEKGVGIELVEKYQINSYPTYLFINGKGKMVHRGLGYFTEKEFIQFAKDADDANKKLNI